MPDATKRPDRGEYRDPSLSDLVSAIKRALADDDWSHHRAGRYTTHRTYTEHQPDARPGDKHVTIRVTECEREIILNIPEEHADSVLGLLAAHADTGGDEGDP